MKKLLVMLFTLVVAFSLAMPVFAQETTTTTATSTKTKKPKTTKAKTTKTKTTKTTAAPSQ